MSVIVKNKSTQKKYILLGTGFGAYKAIRPSLIGGNLLPHEEEGMIKVVAVCDYKGDINWINSDNLQVIEIDGIKISEIDLFSSYRMKDRTNINKKLLNHCEVCPTCGTKVKKNEKYCPGCGLKLID